jgi:FkbM family methyltransferase
VEVLLRNRQPRGQLGPSSATDLVSPADVEACYRLLLGRAPDSAGLDYWRGAVGTHQVSDLVGAFLDSREFHLGGLYRRVMESAEVTKSHPSTRPIVRIDLADRVQYVDPGDGFVGQAIAENLEYEPHLTRAIADSLQPGDSFVDVGANIGWFSLLAAARVGPTGRVLSIEAVPSNVELLVRSSHANGFENVVAMSVAASDRAGVVLLQRLGGSNAAIFSSAESAAPGDRWVSALPLDGLSSLVRGLDVMKIDVEGAELLVLRGAQDLIRRYQPEIFLEYSPGMLARFPDSGTEEMQAWLESHSYEASIVAFDGTIIPASRLEDVNEYARANSHSHLDIRLTPN